MIEIGFKMMYENINALGVPRRLGNVLKACGDY